MSFDSDPHDDEMPDYEVKDLGDTGPEQINFEEFMLDVQTAQREQQTSGEPSEPLPLTDEEVVNAVYGILLNVGLMFLHQKGLLEEFFKSMPREASVKERFRPILGSLAAEMVHLITARVHLPEAELYSQYTFENALLEEAGRAMVTCAETNRQLLRDYRARS